MDPGLAELWAGLMATYTTATAAKIRADQRSGLIAAELDADNIAAALTWLGERLYYLAAIGVPPFDDRSTLVETLTSIWMKTLYGRTA